MISTEAERTTIDCSKFLSVSTWWENNIIFNITLIWFTTIEMENVNDSHLFLSVCLIEFNIANYSRFLGLKILFRTSRIYWYILLDLSAQPGLSCGTIFFCQIYWIFMSIFILNYLSIALADAKLKCTFCKNELEFCSVDWTNLDIFGWSEMFNWKKLKIILTKRTF